MKHTREPEWRVKIFKMISNVMLDVILLLSLCTGIALSKTAVSAHADKDDMEFDEPGSEQILNRQLWEFAKTTPYKSVEVYVAKAQEKSRVAVSKEIELPNGWRIKPAGKQVEVGRLPYEAIFYRGKLVVLNTGYYIGEEQELSVVDPETGEVVKTMKLNSIFPSAAIGADGNLYISGGFDSKVYMINNNFDFEGYKVGGYAAGIAPVDSEHIAVIYLVATDSTKTRRVSSGKRPLRQRKNRASESQKWGSRKRGCYRLFPLWLGICKWEILCDFIGRK